MKKIVIGILWLLSSVVNAQTQTVSGNLTQLITDNSTITLAINYNNSQNDNTLTGLGFRLHFNQANLVFISTTNTLSTNFISVDTIPVADNNNFDNNLSTSHYIGIAWADFNGNWPNQTLPAKLFDINFLPTGTLSTGSATIINFSRTSGASGYEFSAPPIGITVNTPMITSGNNQTVSEGTALTPFIINYGSGSAGIAVTLIAPNGAIFAGSNSNVETLTTNSSGTITSSALTDNTSGSKTVMVNASNFATQTINYTITADNSPNAISFTGLGNTSADNNLVFNISITDQANNPVTITVLTVSNPSLSGATVSISGNQITYTPRNSGVESLTFSANGISLSTPAVFNVTSGAATITTSAFIRNGSGDITADEQATFTIILRDQYNNPLTDSSNINLTAVDSLPRASWTISHNGNGTALATYTPISTGLGGDNIKIAINGINLTQSRTITVVAGIINASMSEIVANTDDTIIVNQSATWTITLKDTLGNPATNLGGLSLSAIGATLAGANWSINNNNNSTAIATYLPGQAGNETGLQILLGNTRIGSNQSLIVIGLATLTTSANNGTITSNPTGINCGTDCSQTYILGIAVTLTATADSGYTFTHWSNDCSGTNHLLTLLINNNQSCTANFASDYDGDGIADAVDNDDDNDGIPDGFETANGLDPFDNSDASSDPDNDGQSNLVEFNTGTDPNNRRIKTFNIFNRIKNNGATQTQIDARWQNQQQLFSINSANVSNVNGDSFEFDLVNNQNRSLSISGNAIFDRTDLSVSESVTITLGTHTLAVNYGNSQEAVISQLEPIISDIPSVSIINQHLDDNNRLIFAWQPSTDTYPATLTSNSQTHYLFYRLRLITSDGLVLNTMRISATSTSIDNSVLSNNRIDLLGMRFRVDTYLADRQGNISTKRDGIYQTLSGAKVALSVSTNGNGTVSCGTNTTTSCNQSFVAGTTLTLTANPDSGYEFNHWRGDCSPYGNTNPITITLNADQSCIGVFSLNIDNAINNTGLVFSATDTNDANWFGQTVISFAGGSAAQSGDIGNNEQSCLQTQVSGAGNLSFYWQVSSERSYDFLSFYVDDQPMSRISGEVNWRQQSYSLSSASSHTLKWCYDKDFIISRGQDSAWIDSVMFAQQYELSIDMPTNGNVISNDNIIHCDDNSTDVGNTQTNLAFDESTTFAQCSNSYDTASTITLTATADNGYVFDAWGGDCSSGGGTPTYEFNINANTTCSASFTVNGTSLADTLDTTLTFNNAGDANWFSQTNITNDGIDAAQSGNVSNNQYSCIDTNTTGAQKLQFDWRVSSEQGWDYLYFYIDGNEVDKISGEVDWHTQTYNLPKVVSLTWCYQKDRTISRGTDAGWLDKVVLISPATYSLSVITTNGTVTISPNSADYVAGSRVSLTPTSDGGYSFGQWQGCDSVNGNICIVTMNSNRVITATFINTSDATPEPFFFGNRLFTSPNATVTSRPTKITGINIAATISISGGAYRINNGVFTTGTSTINNGDDIIARINTSNQFDTNKTATITIGGVSATFRVRTRSQDTIPELFAFNLQRNTNPSTALTSNPATITGIDGDVAVNIVGGQYSINNNAFTTTAGTITNGDNIRVRHTAANTYGAFTITAVGIGSTTATFVSNTRLQDFSPDNFTFNQQIGVNREASITSNVATITGIDDTTNIELISTNPATLLINGIATNTHMISNNDTVQIVLTASPDPQVTSVAELIVGNIRVNFKITTTGSDLTPDAFSFESQTSVDSNTNIVSNIATITGISDSTTITITGGYYRIAGMPATNTTGQVTNGTTLTLSHLSAGGVNQSTTTIVDINGVTASFKSTTRAQNTTLTLTLVGDGIVTSLPIGIDCGSSCTANYRPNSKIRLKAMPADGYRFSGFSGACRSGVVVASIQSITCNTNFVIIPSNTLTDFASQALDSGEHTGLMIADINADGSLDILSIANGNLQWREINNTTTSIIDSNLSGRVTLAVIDINGDGYQDIVAAISNANTIAYYTNDGNQTFTKTNIDNNINRPLAIDSVDLDNDGDVDVLVSTYDKVIVYQNNNNSFKKHTLVNNLSGVISLQVGDLDNDNDNDIALTTLNGNALIILEQQNNSFIKHTIDNEQGGNEVIIADIDNDAQLDIALTSAFRSEVAWYQHIGSTLSFNKIIIDANATNTRSLSASDINGDGLLDLVANSNANNNSRVHLYQNAGNNTFKKRTIATNNDSQGIALSVANINNIRHIIVSTDNGIYTYNTQDAYNIATTTDGSGVISTNTRAVSSTLITLTATPTNGNTFIRWAGSCSGNTTTTTIISSSANSINECRAIFRDITPDAFTFNPSTQREVSANTTSNIITISGIDGSATLTIIGATYTIAGVSSRASRTVTNGTTLSIITGSSANYETTSFATLTIGGVQSVFSVTTRAQDFTPNNFSFNTRSDVATNTDFNSAGASVTGIDSTTTISIVGGRYIINNNPATNTQGEVNNNDTVVIILTASANDNTTTTAVLTIGNTSAVFSVTTALPAIIPTYTLILNTSGNGNIFANPTASSYQQGSAIILTANPNGTVFSHWSLGCSGNANPLTIVINANLSCIANFVSVLAPNNIIASTDDNTSVNINWSAVSNADTYEVYRNSSRIATTTITNYSDVSASTTPASYTIKACIGNVCSVFSSIATGNLQQRFTLSISPTINGNILGACNNNNGLCSQSYVNNTNVELVAIASEGYTFSGWSGSCSDNNNANDNPLTLRLDQNQICLASFATTTYVLTINQTTNGTVTVVNNATCGGGSCTLDVNTLVRLMATPAAGARFTGWTGDCRGNANPQRIRINRDRTCSGVFSDDDSIANPFEFTRQRSVATSATIYSNIITITGINTVVAIRVLDGEYRINDDTWTITAGEVKNNDTVQVRHTSANTGQTVKNTILRVGIVGARFTSITGDLDTDGDGIPNSIDSDDDNDGIPDDFDAEPLDPANASRDDDNDDFTNLAEYLAGTDPTVFASAPTKTQIIYGVVNESAKVGDSVTITIYYNTSNNKKTLSGLTLATCFASSTLNNSALANLATNYLFSNDNTPSEDTSDQDANPITDACLNITWLSFAFDFPGQSVNLPFKLFDLITTINPSATIGSTTTIDFKLDTASSYLADKRPIELEIAPAFNFDVDNSGQIHSYQDGFMILNYLTSGSVPTRIISGNATRSATQTEAYIQMLVDNDILDIDGNGSIGVLTDGFAIMLYMLDPDNINDDSINRIISNDAVYDTPAAIKQRIRRYIE